MPDEMFDRLIMRYCMGDIDPAAFDLLCADLDRSPDRRASFVQMVLQVESFRQVFDAQQAEETSLQESDESADILNEIVEAALVSRRRSEVERQASEALAADLRRRHAEALKAKADAEDQTAAGPRVLVIPKSAVWGAIAAVILLALILISQLPGSNQAPPADSPLAVEAAPAEPAVVGQVKDSLNAVWGRDGLAPSSEGGLSLGWYTLEAGAVELTLSRGAELLVQAPCRFELVGDNLARVERGRLVADVPSAAVGFTVEAGKVRVVDLGTAFGVDVNAFGAVTAAVFEGEVVVGSRLADVPSVSIKAGQAASATTEGHVGSAQSTRSLFRPVTFARNLDDAVRSPDQRYARQVLADEPLLYWRFEQIAQGRVFNSDESGRPDAVVLGQVRDDRGVFGRGVRFSGAVSDIGMIESRGGMFAGNATAYTIEMWVKPDRVQYARIAGLLGQTPSGHTGMANLNVMELLGDRDWLEGWVLRDGPSTDASFRMFHRSPLTAPIEQGQNLWPSQRYEPGQWMLLTAVKAEGEIALFHNGRRIAQMPDGQGIAGPVLLTIGSYGFGRGREGQEARPFAGVIDEVAVYGHALDPEQIALRYRLGLENLQSRP